MSPEDTRLWTPQEIISELKRRANRKYRENMSHFAIDNSKAPGVRTQDLRSLARKIHRDKNTGMQLWNTGIHEAMILATMLIPAEDLTSAEMDHMVSKVNSWDVCDHFTGNPVSASDLVVEKIRDWHSDSREFVKRAAFSSIAQLACRPSIIEDNLEFFFACIRQAATDQRNFVKKSVNWALRDIGKISIRYHELALELAKDLAGHTEPSSRWIGKNAVRELDSEKVVLRLKTKNS